MNRFQWLAAVIAIVSGVVLTVTLLSILLPSAGLTPLQAVGMSAGIVAAVVTATAGTLAILIQGKRVRNAIVKEMRAGALELLAIRSADRIKGDLVDFDSGEAELIPVRWERCRTDLADTDDRIFYGAGIGKVLLDVVNRHSSGEIATLGNALSRPRQRLVLLGEGGAGKSVCLSTLAQRMLESRVADDPVAVKFSVANWNVEAQSFQDWIIQELYEYPDLDAEHDGRSIAERLLADGVIFPLLDGFDELAEGVLARALYRINSEYSIDRPIVLASRSAAYERAVGAGHGRPRPLVAALVVCLQPLTDAEIRRYLIRNVPERGAESLSRLADRAADLGALGTLARPLMIGLARRVAMRDEIDPRAIAAIRDSAGLSDLLIERFLVDAFSNTDGSPFYFDSGYRSMASCRRYLRFLASVARRSPSLQDVRWWEMVQSATPAKALLGVLGVAFGFFAIFLSRHGGGSVILYVALPMFAVLCGSCFTIGYSAVRRITGQRGGRPGGFRGLPSILTILRRTGYSAIAVGAELTIVLILDTPADLNGQLYAGAANPTSRIFSAVLTGILLALAGGSVLGVSAGFALSLRRRFDELVSPANSFSPFETFNRDRLASLSVGFVLGFLLGLIGVITSVLLNGFVLTSAFLGFGVGLLFFGVPASALFTAWTPWRLLSPWFVFRRQLPPRTWRFIHYAYKHQVFKQAGASFRFRHIEVQNFLLR